MYLVLANLYLCVFYGFYRLFLSRETFFQGNRIYLLVSLLLAFTLPLAEYDGFEGNAVYHYQLPVIELGGASSGTDVSEAGIVKPSASPTAYLPVVYGVGCGFSALLVLLQAVATIAALRKRKAGSAFSFFGRIHVDDTVYGSQRVVRHEQVHARQWHSADIVLMQAVKIFNWFNPVVYLYERAIRLQHEYIADGQAAANDQFAYAELLVSRAMGANGPVLANSFSNSRLLKRRIAMLFRDKSPRLRSWRYAALLPVVAVLLIFSLACNHQGSGGDRADTLGAAGAPAGPAVDSRAFLKALGSHVDYREEAMRSGKQGLLAFTFEKTGAGTIANISFLNELGGGLEDAVVRALQLDAVAQAAPEGKSLASIHFRISGTDEETLPPPPPPVSGEYNMLGDVVVVGYLPPPPPPVAPARQASNDGGRDETESYAVQDAPQVSKDTEAALARPADEPVNTAVTDPEPPGGMRAFMQYIGTNYDFPQEAIEAGVNGMLQVSFVVEKDGSLTDLKLVRDLGYGTGEAAIRVLEEGDRWAPAIQDGKPVRTAYTLPIRLNLQQ